MIAINSMTGFGRGEIEGEHSWVVEIKSVNHRFLEIYVRLPRPWLSLEERIKSYLKKKISRGRIDVFVNLSSKGFPAQIKLDKQLASSYFNNLLEVKDELKLGGQVDLSLLSLVPDVLVIEEKIPVEVELWESLFPALEMAVKGLRAMRSKEGIFLGRDLISRLNTIKAKLKIIDERAEIIPDCHYKRLSKNLEKLTSGSSLEQERLEMEVALLAEKSSITEEIIRLSSHIEQLKTIVASEDAIGKKMDFIAQEMFREANTIASKAADYTIIEQIIDIKSEVEKIREQVQNIE